MLAQDRSPKAFVSYSRADYPFANALIRMLSAEIRFELDLMFLRPGDDWEEEIRRKLSDCDFLVVLVSPDSMGSEAVALEVDTAFRMHKRVLPIVIEDVESLLFLAGLHLIDGRRSVRSAAAALRAFAQGGSSPKAVPSRYRSKIVRRWPLSNGTSTNIPICAWLAYQLAAFTIPLNIVPLSVVVYRGEYSYLLVAIPMLTKLTFLHLFVARKLNLYGTILAFGIFGILPSSVLISRGWKLDAINWHFFLGGTLAMEAFCVILAALPLTVRAWLPLINRQPKNFAEFQEWLFKYRVST